MEERHDGVSGMKEFDEGMLSQFEEKTLSVQPIFSGRIIDVEQLQVMLPDGNTAVRDIVRHKGASAVVAVTPEGRFVMVRQYRKPNEQVFIEIPAGKLDPGESPEVCAARELKEETGYTAGRIRPLLRIHSTPGFSDEVLHLFVADDLRKGGMAPDHDEFLSCFEMTREEVLSGIRSGAITDAKTVSGILAVLFDVIFTD